MLSNFSPYVPQGLMPQQGLVPQFYGQGFPQVSPGLPGQPGAHGVNAPFAQDFAHLGPSSYASNPYLQSLSLFTPNPPLNSVGSVGYTGGPIPAQQIVAVLAQLGQQISTQSAVIHQLGIALHQLAQQVAVQSLQPHQAAGITNGQAFAGVPPFVGIGQGAGGAGPFTAQNMFAGATQGGYGFSPQAQAWWGGNRSQTIQ
jgi:hypothetical protein